ncbi:MAG: hypothetical protein HQM07_02880 [Zetaproteobacteria bacterium]|nr:hypothetical protein [Zetaproteobacteria bacterium]
MSRLISESVQQCPYPRKAVYALALLQDLKAAGYLIDRSVLHLVNQRFDSTLSLESLPTFFIEVGEERVKLCSGSVCRYHGYDRLRGQLLQQGVEVQSTPCMGRCHAPPVANVAEKVIEQANLEICLETCRLVMR